MRILVCSPGFMPAQSAGGPPFSTFFLCRGLQRVGAEVRVVTTDWNGPTRLDVPTNRWTNYEEIPVWYARNRGGPVMYSPSGARVISEWMPRVDCVINSGTLWFHLGFASWRAATRYRTPSLTYVRGLLDPWAFNFKPFRKRIYWRLVGQRILRDSTVVVALSESERHAIRALNVSTRIEVVPNGASVDLEHSSRTTLDASVPALRGRRYVLFLGRLHAKKGLDMLLEAISIYRSEDPDMCFVVAGPVDLEYATDWQHLVERFGLSGALITPGPVSGALKAALFHYADVFVLPSRSEGLPVAVLEALAAGCPVVITKPCNLPEVEEARAGIVIEPDPAQIVSALRAVLKDENLRRAMSDNARALARKSFDWDVIAQRTITLCREVMRERTPGRTPLAS
ncbi:MAG: glycosyltransferase [Vicinamibacterales bacterium]